MKIHLLVKRCMVLLMLILSAQFALAQSATSVLDKTAEKYRECYRLLTGKEI